MRTLPVIFGLLVLVTAPARAGEPVATERNLVDAALAEHRRAVGIAVDRQAATPQADDAEFLRRVTLDLAGRIPTVVEQRTFAAAPAMVRRVELVDRLLAGPEFPLHFARVLDDWIQRDKHGDEAFVEWLRNSLKSQTTWDAMFRQMLVGPWDAGGEKGPGAFYKKRAKDLDALTSDTSRAFFGVDITCARCHDHPLVDDWKQEHYYGLASFFHKPQSSGKGSSAGDKNAAELTFASKRGGQKTARPMFLSGMTVSIDAPAKDAKPADAARRAKLVEAALADDQFFRRSAVNRMWAWFFGRGLVEPIDQMHSGNPASVPQLLDALADDFAAHGYDLRRLAKQIVTSEVYQASNRAVPNQVAPNQTAPNQTAADLTGIPVAPRLKPLTPRQFVMSLAAAVDPSRFEAANESERVKQYAELEKQLAVLLPELDPTVEGYQAGYREALYLANHADVQTFVGVGTGELKPGTLVPRLIALKTNDARIAAAYEALLGRRPTAEEVLTIARIWNAEAASPDVVRERVADLIWALVTSAEFRFNH